jgi:hypothetical protein
MALGLGRDADDLHPLRHEHIRFEDFATDVIEPPLECVKVGMEAALEDIGRGSEIQIRQ